MNPQSNPEPGHQAQPVGPPPHSAPNPVVADDFSPSPAAPPESKQSFIKRWSKKSGAVLLTLLFLISPLLVVAFVIQSYQVDGQSMQNTLQNNDRLLVDKLPRSWARLTHHAYLPKRGNIIIFNQAGLFDSAPGQQKQLIKRVIGLPGEHVVIKNGYITIYNAQHPDGFNPDKTVGYKITAPETTGDIDLVLKSNEIFVCGDNRLNSEDSRYFGPVDTNNIVGKLVLRIVPLNEARRF